MGGWLELLIALNAALTDVFFAMAEDGRRSLLLLKMPALVMCGGSLGAASRYGIGLLAVRIWGAGFPWGTLIVNLVGCFFIGLVFGLGDSVRFLTSEMRLLLVTGYLGALTTFSTFCLETVAAAGTCAGVAMRAPGTGGSRIGIESGPEGLRVYFHWNAMPTSPSAICWL
jgi:protein CrcB